MLSDTDRTTIKEYGLYNPSERDGIAIPAAFVVDTSGAVRYARVQNTVFRARAKKLLAEVRKLR